MIKSFGSSNFRFFALHLLGCREMLVFKNKYTLRKLLWYRILVFSLCCDMLPVLLGEFPWLIFSRIGLLIYDIPFAFIIWRMTCSLFYVSIFFHLKKYDQVEFFKFFKIIFILSLPESPHGFEMLLVLLNITGYHFNSSQNEFSLELSTDNLQINFVEFLCFMFFCERLNLYCYEHIIIWQLYLNAGWDC